MLAPSTGSFTCLDMFDYSLSGTLAEHGDWSWISEGLEECASVVYICMFY